LIEETWETTALTNKCSPNVTSSTTRHKQKSNSQSLMIYSDIECTGVNTIFILSRLRRTLPKWEMFIAYMSSHIFSNAFFYYFSAIHWGYYIILELFIKETFQSLRLLFKNKYSLKYHENIKRLAFIHGLECLLLTLFFRWDHKRRLQNFIA